MAKSLVKPVVNAVAILRLLSNSGAPATATQIARALGLNTSTCFNILRTLTGEGLVTFDLTGKTYAIGPGMARLVRNALSDEDQLTVARHRLQDLAEEFGVTVCLWRRSGLGRMTLVAMESGSGNLRIQMRMGQRLPVLLGSAGRALAPHLGLTKREIGAEFKKLRWSRPLKFADYWAQVEEAAERGWAIDDAYFSPGIITAAAPVFDRQERAFYALGVLMFSGQHTEATIARMGEAMVDLSARLTDILY